MERTMDDFAGTRAVVTGGASGIGFGLATAVAQRGAAAVVLMDIEPVALDAAVAQLSAAFPQVAVSSSTVDVTDSSAMEQAVAQIWERIGGIDVMCLNAGVFAGGRVWEIADDDWDWVMNVNVKGVVHGMRSVVPRMIAAGTPALVTVTASVAGVVAAPVSAPYVASKFAAVGLAESLQQDLGLAGVDHIDVAVICPSMVSTNIGTGDRNRPSELGESGENEGVEIARAGIELAMNEGMDPIEGGKNAIDQIASGRFYVSTHSVEMWERLVGNENDDRLAGRPPRFQMYE
jgi:NAD(P)-dependent dehydrogenase (short-subunit alcohol dehydrogenase family)